MLKIRLKQMNVYNIAFLVVIIAIQRTNSQLEQNETTTSQTMETTTSPQFIQTYNDTQYYTITEAATTEVTTREAENTENSTMMQQNTSNITTSQIVRQQRSDSNSNQGLSQDEYQANHPIVKVVDKNDPTSLESASRVVITNDVRDNSRKNVQTVLKDPVKHFVDELDEELAKKLITEKLEQISKMNTEEKYKLLYETVSSEHPCLRECQEGEEPRICYYSFEIEWYQSMSKACYDCPYNEDDCNRMDCIPADGVSRTLTVINRKMPGPAIEVCQNDRIIVDVENSLLTEATTMHWHGIHQRGTPYMDGTPFVTQCPILSETSFRYQFNASQYGTYFWHSHSGMQRADGAAGALIIRQPKSQDVHGRLYDYDRPEHTMIVTDWIHTLSLAMFTDHHHSSGDNKPPTLLVNGLGRFKTFNETSTKKKYMKAARFNVEQGYRYRFRVINAEFLNCPIEMTVDGHNITVIASDGYDLEPVTATSLVTYAGERFDFILDADNEIDNYWIRFRGLMDCDERFTKAKQVAVLHYEGAMEEEPAGDLTWEESHVDGLQINPLNKGEEDDETICIPELRSIAGDSDSLNEIPDYQFYVAYDFYPKNNTSFHKTNYYGFNQVKDDNDRVYTPQLNHISMKMPSSPLLVARPSTDEFCNASSVDPSCLLDHCTCSHVLSVRLGAVVEIVIVDEGVAYDANHPFHLHGHSFRVIAMRHLNSTTTVDQVKEFDRAGLLTRNLVNAPIKDTVSVPDGGYTVIRFKADNPGYWLFHCHIEFHAEIGMALVFKVGEHSDMPPVPPSFPTCGNYMPDNLLEHATTEKAPEGSFININQWWPLSSGNSSASKAGILLLSNSLFVICLALLSLYFS